MYLFFKNMTIKFKLFLTYATVCVVIFSLSFALLFSQVQKNITYSIKEELTKSNQMIADMIETTATVSIKNHLRAIAEKNRDILEHFYKEYQESRLTKTEAMDLAVQVILSQKVGETGYIYCVDSNGIAVVHPKEGVVGVNFSHRKFVQSQIKKKEGYLEYNWKNPQDTDLRPKALYMTYFEPWDWIISVSSYKSEFSKLIVIDDFREKISGLTFGKTGYSYIVDTSGTIVIHPELEGVKYDDQNDRINAITEKMIRQKKGFFTYLWKNPSEKKDREKFVAFNSIQDFNWIIASSSYTEEAFTPLMEMKRTFLVILIFTLLFTGVVTMLVSTSITRPLSEVIRRFERGAKGDWASKIEVNKDDEIGKLSNSFNLFMAQLDNYRQELISENMVRKNAEKELETIQHYLSNIINSMPSILIAVDMNKKVSQWNKQAEALTGISMAEAHNKLLPDVFPRLRSHMPKVDESLRKREMQHIAKSTYSTEENVTFHEDITIYPLTADGTEGAVIRIDDVTKKVKMDEIIIQNDKMISIGGLAAGMAHEINNPLAGVIQNANVLSNRLTDKNMPANIKSAGKLGLSVESIDKYMVDRNVPRMLEAINISASRMASIVENMLSFARKSDSHFSSYNIADLVDKSLELAATDYNLKTHFDFKSIVIEKNYEKGLPLIICEESKIQQVLLNILNNGAQAMFEDQKSGNKKSMFSLRLSKERVSNMLCIEIEDNGPGIDEATISRIFEPFFTTKPVGVGTGLGLSVSYFIITENHGGTMSVTSEPGKGAKFIIKLPIEKSSENEVVS